MSLSRNPAERVLGLAFAYEGARALQTAVALGVFDRLAGRGATAAEVAGATAAVPAAMTILLDALAGLGLLRKRGARYTNGPDAARHLVSTSPRSLCDLIRFAANRYPEWERLPQVALTGRQARPDDFFQYDAVETRAFIRGMHNLAVGRGDAMRLPGLVDLSRARTLVDLGGGPGTYSIHLCRRFPRLRATIIDFRGSLGVAREIVAEAGMEERVTLREGNFLTQPIGGPWDAALVSNIVHGLDVQTNRRLMRRIFDALSPGATIIVKDHLMDRSLTKPAGGAVFALTMLMYTPGRCYGTHEIKGWLDEAGFRGAVRRRVPGAASVAVLVARKPGLKRSGGPGR